MLLRKPRAQNIMEYRQLGRSGLKVPALTLGTGTFGGTGNFASWGTSGVAEATRLVDICLEAGLNMFDSANIYSMGLAEEILGQAIKGRRDKVLISTKGTFRFGGEGPNDTGSSRHHLTRAVEGSLKRLGTDYIDLYQLHGFDALTPVEEVLSTLDGLVRAGKIRYIGCSNFSGWHLMKSLAYAEKHGLARYVANQAYYSLIGREYEWELMPLGVDQGVGCVVWSPLGWGRLTGKIRRGNPPAQGTRATDQLGMAYAPKVADEYLFRVIDALDAVAKETGRSVPQVALNWLLQRPTVSTLVIGARNEAQLRDNLGAVGWKLSPEQIAKLDAASETQKIYPYWHQVFFAERNPFPAGS
jgi:aryl-alcohol dehydrogenase-like predicted oxidoreductase